jgi:hypothetical protein
LFIRRPPEYRCKIEEILKRQLSGNQVIESYVCNWPVCDAQ